MQNIRSRETEPEKIVARELRRRKIYFKQNYPALTGKPDIVFLRKRVLVFIDSDFWHANPKRFIMPKTNRSYWKKKLFANQTRDKEVNRILRKEGWRVLRFWEYQIRKDPKRIVDRILNFRDKSIHR